MSENWEVLSGTVNTRGSVLRFLVEGTGYPVLVIGSARYYPRTFSCLLREHLRMAFVDLPHFAERRSPGTPVSITLDCYLSDIEKLRQQVGFERCIVLGHSHHGNLALEYAKRYPLNATHIVLIGSPPANVSDTIAAADSYWQSHASESRKAILRENLEALGTRTSGLRPEEAFVAQSVAEGPKYWWNAAFDASHLWQGVPVNLEAIKEFRRFFAGDYKVSLGTEALRTPTLVVMGKHDYAVPHILWHAIRPCLENLTYYLFEQSGHTPQLEEPQRFDQVLLTWLKGGGGIKSDGEPP